MYHSPATAISLCRPIASRPMLYDLNSPTAGPVHPRKADTAETISPGYSRHAQIACGPSRRTSGSSARVHSHRKGQLYSSPWALRRRTGCAARRGKYNGSRSTTTHLPERRLARCSLRPGNASLCRSPPRHSELHSGLPVCRSSG